MPSCLATEQSLQHTSCRHITRIGYRVSYSGIGEREKLVMRIARIN